MANQYQNTWNITLPNQPTPEYVYLLRANGTGYLFCSSSINPLNRIKDLQTGNPNPLEVLGAYWFNNPQTAASIASQIQQSAGSSAQGGTQWFFDEQSHHSQFLLNFDRKCEEAGGIKCPIPTAAANKIQF